MNSGSSNGESESEQPPPTIGVRNIKFLVTYYDHFLFWLYVGIYVIHGLDNVRLMTPHQGVSR